jgi:hypothetical protein
LIRTKYNHVFGVNLMHEEDVDEPNNENDDDADDEGDEDW